MEKVFEAIEFAALAHHGQLRKGSGVPYIIHPIFVMQKLIECKCSQDTIIAGLLHDVIEDTSYTADDIKSRFGDKVLKLVEFASEPDKSASWQVRKNHTMKVLKDCNDIEALSVVCADKLHNIITMKNDYNKIGEELWSRYNAPKEKQKWYYQSLANIFAKKSRKHGDIFEELVNEVKNFFND